MQIYKCQLCGNIAVKLVEGEGHLNCCGRDMEVLQAGTTDAALEKHVPALQLDGGTLKVQVGEVLHPMTPEHSIQMILVEQDGKIQYRTLTPEDAPVAEFRVEPGKPLEVYEYCNLHGLWKSGT